MSSHVFFTVAVTLDTWQITYNKLPAQANALMLSTVFWDQNVDDDSSDVDRTADLILLNQMYPSWSYKIH